MESDQETLAASATTTTTTTMIKIFMDITSSTEEEAKFFLESHKFDVDAAISTFFESNSTSPTIAVADSCSVSGADASIQSPSPSASPSRSRSRSPPSGTRKSTNNNSNDDDDNNGRSSNSRSRIARVGGVRNLANLDRNASGSHSDSDHDHDHARPPQRVMILQDNDVDAIFEQARRMRAIKGPLDVHQPSSSSRSFTGKARLLSGETVSASPQERDPEVIWHTLTFWRNGFTVDDRPLRRFDDEGNAPFLESIKRTECPKELESADGKNPVIVNLVRRYENCPEPKKRRIAFEGVGRTLGTSSLVSSGPAPATALNSAPSPLMGLVVDDKLPSTSIQLRVADGTRTALRFNYHHTIRDIHAFIDASMPARTGAYTLQMMGFPPKQLTDLDQTIEQAGLANSVVILKFS
ncbi:plant UBX domain-containing protein 4 [Beta vulgaris subsp. vulgaris]|uniref:plant UBX domain-containing protein 4 n=1 Tax=Beta vulgaris subsp. vulgaris TaxID=3555 RepID=UPI0025483BF0|nr:plant UBX domain-containing protein 4 [Beta vulgaris subsp. vulgaris]